MFKVGQKVVCIKKDITRIGYIVLPGEIHIVSEIYTYPKGMYNTDFALMFEATADAQWYPPKFRPLDYAFVEEVIKQVQPEKQPA